MNKFLNYLRQPTTLIGLSLTIGAILGNIFGAISESVAATILGATTPLWVSDTSAQAKVSAVEGALIPATHGLVKTGETETK